MGKYLDGAPMGPNVKRLMIYKASQDAIPPGGGMGDGINFLLDPDRVKATFRSALEFVEAACYLMKSSPDNPYGDDDEAICGAILEGLEDRISPIGQGD